MNYGLRPLLAFTLVLGGLAGGIFSAPAPTRAAELEEYQRKYISFYQLRPVPYDKYVIQGFQKELPRFDYRLLGTGGRGNLLEFLNLVKKYQLENAGQMAANQENDNVKIGDKVVSWSDTKRIMESAYVFATDWSWGEVDLGHLRRKSKNSNTWLIDLEADLQMKLDIYKLSGSQPELYSQQATSWKISKTYELSNFNEILRIVKEATGDAVDPDNVLVQPLIVEVIKKIPFYAQLLNMNPEASLRAEAEKKLADDGSTGLTTEIKRLNDFILKNQIDSADMAQDQVTVKLSGTETVDTLGIGLDQGFKVIEYRMQNGQEVPVDVGFTKVRELANSQFRLQPIIVGRDYEAGDQMIEYPKTGAGIGFSLGTVPLGFEGQEQNMFVPQASLDIEYSLAQASGVSELYFTFLGGMAMPQQANLSQATVPTGRSVDAGASVLPFDLEIGLMKRWYMRQLIFSLGLRGGALAGTLLGSGLDPTPTALGLGGTLLAGLHYQATADMILGLNLGWRYFSNAEFSIAASSGSSTSPVAYPAMNSNGPVIQAFLNYAF
ncbi:hypothetical protein COW36_13050 [bacterium (Candidatus Blackallbacteria) CG17_big_fil_post_rev_8_21_14_2_50_48_46]|uniref:Uncharacterized protein n=1 Tax=bacterium (Candidatus Blackallbacteria) CG17_big_fil_post_rev_8_21_14_2_50_48_46 TaxID=2014261 RepID=A0A2M7G4E4_9BACT|nr:MAG: hypothetical protein COW64_02215 [bacterium (Candidatus Blackallbacteria) CG18_big_fil_WC_8_21_14_2_50_49_26]PIW16687.1 MAG: hypothetical protein COW36_13050 [bacterium (Candidatus Blackallbacteria) CG17_big_fil_post_rev_8_21_14_2_50_48_46]PIW46193.1 MAG: hypothetical protein COW20_18305 [bacterium (Candidatus Blackallbacteria) CG13_big_fil_rev_8_21_14_2_50_49_14]